MATLPLIPVDEYLATNYRPDREYIDGVIEERNLGEYDHARLQLMLGVWFGNRERGWNVRAVVEQRIRVSPSRYRIPDIAVLERDQPIEPIFTRAPLLIIEVLSPRDTLHNIEERVTDYLNFGVAHIWIIDPKLRKAWIATRGHLQESGDRLEIPRSPVYVSLPELFESCA